MSIAWSYTSPLRRTPLRLSWCSHCAQVWASDGILADLHSGLVSGENIASILTDKKKTRKAYLEGLPAAGSLTSSHAGYVKRHDPFAYFRTVLQGTRNYSAQTSNLVPFETNFETDLRNHTFPNYAFIGPDIYDDGHDDAKTHRAAACGDHGVLKQIDQWLNKNIRPLVEDAEFQRSGLLIIVFDEACSRGPRADNRFNPRQPSARGGGHVAVIIISSKTAPGTGSDLLLRKHAAIVPQSAWNSAIPRCRGKPTKIHPENGLFWTELGLNPWAMAPAFSFFLCV